MRTTLLVVTLNEIEGMRAIMPRVDRSWCDQILVLDGGSTDGTQQYAWDQGYELYVQKERGLRFAYREVWPLIRGDWVITFSPDGNSIPEAIPQLIEKMRGGYDMVIASRYLDGAKSQDDDWITGFGNRLFTGTINFFFRGRYTDAMVIFRIYRKELVYELGLHLDAPYAGVERLFCTKISWEPLLSARAAKYGRRLAEIPADEPPRIGGERKLQVLQWGAAYYSQFLLELLKPARTR